MQSSDDVGKIAQATPLLIGLFLLVGRALVLYKGYHSLITFAIAEARAMEVFVERLSKGSAALASAKEGKTVTSTHLYVLRCFWDVIGHQAVFLW